MIRPRRLATAHSAILDSSVSKVGAVPPASSNIKRIGQKMAGGIGPTCLRELLERDFREELPEVDPLALPDDEQGRERDESAVRDAVRNESGREVLRDAVLGHFSFQELAMDDDYGRPATEIAVPVHFRRIAGDVSTPPSFAPLLKLRRAAASESSEKQCSRVGPV